MMSQTTAPPVALPTEDLPATCLHAGDQILARRSRRAKSQRVTVERIVKGSTGPGGHNFVAATCKPVKGSEFTINVPSGQLVPVLSRKARIVEPTGYLGRNVA